MADAVAPKKFPVGLSEAIFHFDINFRDTVVFCTLFIECGVVSYDLLPPTHIYNVIRPAHAEVFFENFTA